MINPTTVYLRTYKKILEEIYGNVEEGLRRTAITNIIHCNYGISRDNMPVHVAEHCAYNKDFQLTKHEINILNPNTIISLAGRKKEGYLKNNWGLDQKKIYYCGSPAARGRCSNDIISVVKNFLHREQ